MAQLTALDAGFLKSRDPERHPGLAIGAVAVVNGAAPSYDQLKTVLTERIKSIPRCTQVLATEWIDYPGFDLTQHVRRVALPRPGDEAELFRAIALALERPLDPDRPLWEMLDHRRPQRQPLGDLDKNPPLHGRRHVGGPPAGQALRRCRRQCLR